MKKILLIVDCQYDFVNPDGALYVKDSWLLPTQIADIMDKFDAFAFTLDWHPLNHCSFKENGGQWPRHCVEYSNRASIYDFLLEKAYGKPNLIFRKGECPYREEYGAFGEHKELNARELLGFINTVRYRNGEDSVDLYVCGVAGDYCVQNTVEDIVRNDVLCEKIHNVILLKDLCPCIDKSWDMEAFCREHAVTCINYPHINEGV